MALNFTEIEFLQQVITTVPAPSADDGPHFFAFKHLLQLAHTTLHGTGKIEIMVKDRIQVKRFIAKALEFPTARLQQVGPNVTAGRNNPNGVAAAQSGWLDARMGRIRHSKSHLR